LFLSRSLPALGSCESNLNAIYSLVLDGSLPCCQLIDLLKETARLRGKNVRAPMNSDVSGCIRKFENV
jgi:hypothetical protein